MKRFKNVFLVLLLSVAVVACNKSDDDGGDGGGAAEGTVTAKVDGANFTSMSIATTAVQTTAGGVTTLRIQGSDADGKGIILTITGFDGTGSYDVGGGADIFTNAIYVEANVSNPTDSQSWMAPFDESVAGEINISEINETNVTGTFSFTGKNSNDDSTKTITEGAFNANF